MNAGLRRFRAAQARYEEAMTEFGNILDRQEETIQTLLAYLPITQVEILRLDNRIDAIDGDYPTWLRRHYFECSDMEESLT